MNLRLILVSCAAILLVGACQKRDASLVASTPAPAASPAEPAAPAAPASVAAPAEPVKDKSWAGQVNEAKSVASAQGNAAQDRAEKADAAAK